MLRKILKFSEKTTKNTKKNLNTEEINQHLSKKKSRHHGIDLVRIVANILIINHHIIYHGGPLFKSPKNSKELKFFVFLNIICCSGVDIYGMISGFVGFHIHKYSNLFYILITTCFYSYGIAYFLKNYYLKLRVVNLNHYLYPVFVTDYWYVTAYFCMYFFLPILNKGIQSIEKKDMKYFIIVLFLMFSCLREIKNYTQKFNFDMYKLSEGFTYTWLIILYLYGGYFGKFKTFIVKNKVFFYLKNVLIIILFAYIRTKIILYKFKKINKLTMTVDYVAPASVMVAIGFINIFGDFNKKINI